MSTKTSGQALLLAYFQDHVNDWLHNRTLRSATGMDDVPRAIRMLRQQGWPIEKDGRGSYRLTSLDKQPPQGIRSSIDGKIRYLVLHSSGGRCRMCGRGYEDGVRLVVDHIRPVAWGGTNDISNLQALCEQCNHGKQAWVSDESAEAMRRVFDQPTVEARIEALFDSRPNTDVPSLLIQLVSGNALDWQRALRRIRERTGKPIKPVANRTAYRYFQ